jgi:cytochrome c peroxidase
MHFRRLLCSTGSELRHLAMSDAAIRGSELFRDRGTGASCHPILKRWSLLTDPIGDQSALCRHNEVLALSTDGTRSTVNNGQSAAG